MNSKLHDIIYSLQLCPSSSTSTVCFYSFIRLKSSVNRFYSPVFEKRLIYQHQLYLKMTRISHPPCTGANSLFSFCDVKMWRFSFWIVIVAFSKLVQRHNCGIFSGFVCEKPPVCEVGIFIWFEIYVVTLRNIAAIVKLPKIRKLFIFRQIGRVFIIEVEE